MIDPEARTVRQGAEGRDTQLICRDPVRRQAKELKPITPFWVFALGAAALIYLCLYVLWLKHVPELVPLGSEIGEIFLALSLAYLAGLIFYGLTVHLPQHQGRTRALPHVAFHAYQVVTIAQDVVGGLERHSGIRLGGAGYPRSDQLHEMLAGVRLINGGRMMDGDDEWWRRFRSVVGGTKRHAAMILPFYPWLDGEFLGVLAAVQGGSLFNLIDDLESDEDVNQSLQAIFPDVMMYFGAIRDLHAYLEGGLRAALPPGARLPPNDEPCS